jgi:hypothetical protein
MEGLSVIRHGGGGEKARVVCGFLGCDLTRGNPLTSALPPIMRFDAREGSVAAWMKSSLEFAAVRLLPKLALTDENQITTVAKSLLAVPRSRMVNWPRQFDHCPLYN